MTLLNTVPLAVSVKETDAGTPALAGWGSMLPKRVNGVRRASCARSDCQADGCDALHMRRIRIAEKKNYLDISLEGPASPFQGRQALRSEDGLRTTEGAGQGSMQVSQQACSRCQIGVQLPGSVQPSLQHLDGVLQALCPLLHLCDPLRLSLPLIRCGLCSLQ